MSLRTHLYYYQCLTKAKHALECICSTPFACCCLQERADAAPDDQTLQVDGGGDNSQNEEKMSYNIEVPRPDGTRRQTHERMDHDVQNDDVIDVGTHAGGAKSICGGGHENAEAGEDVSVASLQDSVTCMIRNTCLSSACRFFGLPLRMVVLAMRSREATTKKAGNIFDERKANKNNKEKKVKEKKDKGKKEKEKKEKEKKGKEKKHNEKKDKEKKDKSHKDKENNDKKKQKEEESKHGFAIEAGVEYEHAA